MTYSDPAPRAKVLVEGKIRIRPLEESVTALLEYDGEAEFLVRATDQQLEAVKALTFVVQVDRLPAREVIA